MDACTTQAPPAMTGLHPSQLRWGSQCLAPSLPACPSHPWLCRAMPCHAVARRTMPGEECCVPLPPFLPVPGLRLCSLLFGCRVEVQVGQCQQAVGVVPSSLGLDQLVQQLLAGVVVTAVQVQAGRKEAGSTGAREEMRSHSFPAKVSRFTVTRPRMQGGDWGDLGH